MDFQSVNPLNVRLNMISGNLLPMTESSSFSIFWRTYSVLLWLLQIFILVALIPGCMNVSKEKAFKDGFVYFTVTAEMSFMIARLHACRNIVGQLIRRINDFLSVADDTMKNIVTTTLKPVVKPFKLYGIGGIVALILWCCLSLMLLFEKDVFYYEDYRTPIAVFNQPLSPREFLLGSIVLSICTIYIFVKKVGLDIYMVHIVMMITVQYRYIAKKTMIIFRQRNVDEHNESWESPKWKKRQLKKLCRHHNDLIHTTSLLKDLLSLNLSLLYLSSVMRFCFMAVMFNITTTSWERMLVLSYTTGALVQFYILCSCVQQLLDASTQMMDEAFHQEWYLSESSIKNIFMSLIMANNLECKIALFENFNLSLPSFMKILNQSYTVALLFLKMK